MDVQPSSLREQGEALKAAPVAGVQPTPDYGTVSSGSGIPAHAPHSAWLRHGARSLVFLVAIAVAILVVVLTGRSSTPPVAWSDLENLAPARGDAAASSLNLRQLDRLKPQKQAEALLEMAVAHSDGAISQISSRVHRWQGRLKWDSEMATVTTAAMHSNDMQVRQSGIDVELVAYGLARNSASLQYLLKTADSADHGQKIWALWALGLMGNRGVEPARVLQVLAAHLKDADEDSRHWAVEGLTLIGADETIPLLLSVMHDDSSLLVREAAACGLAQSGMFTHNQRMSAIPQLLNYSDDPSLDAQTRTWAFLALADITHQRLPNDSTAWRGWYRESSVQ
jgi:HEAT repeat protein